EVMERTASTKASQPVWGVCRGGGEFGSRPSFPSVRRACMVLSRFPWGGRARGRLSEGSHERINGRGSMRSNVLKSVVLGVSLAAALAPTAFAKDWKTVVIGMEGAYEPWNLTDPSGNKIVGFEPDLAMDL